MGNHDVSIRESEPYLGLCSCCRKRSVVTACGITRPGTPALDGWSVALCGKCRKNPVEAVQKIQKRWDRWTP